MELQQYLNSNWKLPKLPNAQIKHILQLKTPQGREGKAKNKNKNKIPSSPNTLTSYIIRLNQNTEECLGFCLSSM